MNQQTFTYANKEAQCHKVNRFMVVGIIVFSLLIFALTIGSCINGYRSVAYMLTLVGIMVFSDIINVTMFLKNSRSSKIRYVVLIEVITIGAILAAVYEASYMIFLAATPFIAGILYYDLRFSVIAASSFTLMNVVIVLVRNNVLHQFDSDLATDKLITCFVIFIMMFIIIYTTLVGRKFNEDSLNQLKEDGERQKQIVDEVMNIANQVKQGTEEAMNIVNTLKESAETIKHSVGDIGESTNLTAENIQTQTVMTQNIQSNIENTVRRSENMVKVASRSSELNTHNVETVEELKRQATVLAETNNQVSESMKLLQENVNNVKSITETIFAISSRTNLLALNASIESARAGEAGRGFAVVADQIRELSEKTRKETENIASILEALGQNANQTAEAVVRSVNATEEQDRMINTVAEQVDEMNQNIEELVSDISEIDKMLENLSEANNQIVDNIMQVSATTEEVTASAQQSTEITEKNYADSIEAQKLLRGVLDVSQGMNKFINF